MSFAEASEDGFSLAPSGARKRGIGGHQSAKAVNDEWLTPPAILNALGSFDLDPCAPRVRPWDTAKKHYSIFDDGLKQDWEGRIWLNPPYGNICEQWLARMAAHRNGICLIFARTETRAWQEFIWPVANAVLFVKGRITFYSVDGREAAYNGGAPSALIAYTEVDAAILSRSGIAGAYVPLVDSRGRRLVSA